MDSEPNWIEVAAGTLLWVLAGLLLLLIAHTSPTMLLHYLGAPEVPVALQLDAD